MKTAAKLRTWFKNENPFVLFLIFMAVAMATFASLVPYENDFKFQATKSEVQEDYVGEWSTDPELFHTDGDFFDGTIWQISSYNGKFTLWIGDGGGGRTQNLDGYFEALELSNQFLSKGYKYSDYNYYN